MTTAKLGAAFLLFLIAVTNLAGLWAYPTTPEGLPQRSKPSRTDRQGDPLPAGAIARLGTVRMRRAYQSPCDFAFTPDGKALVSARTSKIVQFWDVKTGKPLQEFRHEKTFDRFILSTNGKILATAGREGIIVWDVANRKQLRGIGAERVDRIGLAPDGKTLASVAEDKVIPCGTRPAVRRSENSSAIRRKFTPYCFPLIIRH
ncbi:MAG TPA: hypothetical protein VN688_14925 [Gemmataceae bacterium]|nr:hypothetical protein [Gemmataceae bacterium]